MKVKRNIVEANNKARIDAFYRLITEPRSTGAHRRSPQEPHRLAAHMAA